MQTPLNCFLIHYIKYRNVLILMNCSFKAVKLDCIVLANKNMKINIFLKFRQI